MQPQLISQLRGLQRDPLPFCCAVGMPAQTVCVFLLSHSMACACIFSVLKWQVLKQSPDGCLLWGGGIAKVNDNDELTGLMCNYADGWSYRQRRFVYVQKCARTEARTDGIIEHNSLTSIVLAHLETGNTSLM